MSAFIKITYKDSTTSEELEDKVIVSVDSNISCIRPNIVREDLEELMKYDPDLLYEISNEYCNRELNSKEVIELLKSAYLGYFESPEHFLRSQIKYDDLPTIDESWLDYVDFDRAWEDWLSSTGDFIKIGNDYLDQNVVDRYSDFKQEKLEEGSVFTFDNKEFSVLEILSDGSILAIRTDTWSVYRMSSNSTNMFKLTGERFFPFGHTLVIVNPHTIYKSINSDANEIVKTGIEVNGRITVEYLQGHLSGSKITMNIRTFKSLYQDVFTNNYNLEKR